MKIVCIGHITYDITFPCDSYPVENTKTRYHDEENSTGGPTAIAAFLLSKWGEETYLAGLVGNDEYGRKIKKELSINHIDNTHVVLNEGLKTSHSLVLANRSNGKRTVLTYSDKHYQLEKFELEDAPDIILLDGYEYEATKHLLKKYPKAITVMDAGRDKKEIIDLARMVNYLICSKEFAEKVTGIKIDFEHKQTLVDAYQKLEKMFKNNIIITLEENGCLYKYQGNIKIMPSIKVKTIDSTGAGDIFHGAFVYGLAQNFDYEKLLKFSNVAGALSVTRVGSYRSIPTLEEMNEVYEQVK